MIIKKIDKKVRSFKNFDLVNYQKDIADIDLTPVLTMDDVNIIYKYYHDQIIAIIDKYAPYITLTNKQLSWRKKPWISRHLQKLIEEKGKLYKKYLAKNKSDFWFNRYKSVKKSLEKSLFEAKRAYFKTYFETNLYNSKKIWQGINEIMHNRTNKANAEIYLDDGGNIVTDQKKVANRFNKFYTNVAKNLLKDLGKSPTKFQDYLRNPNEHRD